MGGTQFPTTNADDGEEQPRKYTPTDIFEHLLLPPFIPPHPFWPRQPSYPTTFPPSMHTIQHHLTLPHTHPLYNPLHYLPTNTAADSIPWILGLNLHAYNHLLTLMDEVVKNSAIEVKEAERELMAVRAEGRGMAVERKAREEVDRRKEKEMEEKGKFEVVGRWVMRLAEAIGVRESVDEAGKEAELRGKREEGGGIGRKERWSEELG